MRSQLKEKEIRVLDATLELVNNSGFHAASMSKIAKLANVAPATIYLYFKNKQDLINKLYLYIKAEFCEYAFRNYNEKATVKDGFKLIWYNIAQYQIRNVKEAMFLSMTDITPMVDENSKEKGLEHLKPLLDLWERGKQEGIIKNYSVFLLYAYTVNPLSFLVSMHQGSCFVLEEDILDRAFQLAWNSIT